MIPGEHSLKEVLKFALVLLGITLLSIFLAISSGSANLAEWMRWFMGVFFAVFASFKLIGYKMFVEMFAGYDIVAN